MSKEYLCQKGASLCESRGMKLIYPRAQGCLTAVCTPARRADRNEAKPGCRCEVFFCFLTWPCLPETPTATRSPLTHTPSNRSIESSLSLVVPCLNAFLCPRPSSRSSPPRLPPPPPLSVQLFSHRPAAQIFSDASNGGTVSMPESAYTAVIRACCLDGRADRAREVLEALKRADVRPRIRCVRG